MLSTPPPDAESALPAPQVIQWYFGPTPWDDRPDAKWHALCGDPYSTGHDGEVWLDHHQGAFCSGCRRYEEGQAEQDIPPAVAAAMPPSPAPWEAPSPQNPTPEAVAAANEGMRAAAQTTTEAPPVLAPLDEGDVTSSAPPTDGGTAAAASNAAAVLTPSEAPVVSPEAAAAARVERRGLLGRIEQALQGDA